MRDPEPRGLVWRVLLGGPEVTMTLLPANKWVTVGSFFGSAQRMLYVIVNADVECKWRERCGPFRISSGSFRGRHSFRVFNQSVQLKSPVDTRCDSQFDEVPGAAPQPH
jgi:hypothetical protein